MDQHTSRHHGNPNHHWLRKLHTGLQAAWILCLSSLQTLISKLNAKCTIIWKGNFGPQSNSPVIFLLSPGKMLLMMFLFQKWLCCPFTEDIGAWWLLMHWLQLQFTPCEALPSVWIGMAWQYSQAWGYPCCLCNFSYPISSFQATFNWICFATALCEQPPLSVMTLWHTLFVKGVNDRLLDHWQVSSVHHYCDYKEQEPRSSREFFRQIFINRQQLLNLGRGRAQNTKLTGAAPVENWLDLKLSDDTQLISPSL